MKIKFIYFLAVLSFGCRADVVNIDIPKDTDIKHYGIYEGYSSRLIEAYGPKTEDQMYLPRDIADIPIKKVTDGYLTKSEISNKNDRLSIYLSQNQQALRFVGLYKQRILAWNEGYASNGMTVEKALNIEALYPFLDMRIKPETTTSSMLQYFENRLGVRDFYNLQRWVAFSTKGEEKKVSEIIEQEYPVLIEDTYLKETVGK